MADIWGISVWINYSKGKLFFLGKKLLHVKNLLYMYLKKYVSSQGIVYLLTKV